MTDILSAQALEFVKRSHTKPFVLYLAHKAVHGPFTAAERHKNLYADATLKPAPNVNDSLNGKPALTRKLEESADQKPKAPKGKKPKVGAEQNSGPTGPWRNQLRALAAIDEGVGQLLKALEESKQLENTMFVFTSDNGYFWGEHGLGDKRWAYEESIRDPLLIRYPKLIKAGTTRDQLVLNIDIAPTFLELAGAPVPKSVQGRSLLPLLRNPKTPWRTSILTEYFQERSFQRVPTWQSVRTDRWKYIHYTNLDEMDELYDLKSDRYEMKNLVKERKAQVALNEMKAELEKLRKEF
jgi:N-acetylglucosamine-6-sulfatase